MALALLLPGFAPNLYDLAAMLRSDRVILQDVERWSRKSRVHRAKIRAAQGTQWINIPVRTADKKKAIRDVRIDQERDWVTPILRTLRFNYRNSIYYDFYEPEIRADFQSGRDYTYLLPFIEYIRKRLFRFMEIEIEEEYASQLNKYTSDPDELARRLGADTLYQEHDARHYQRQADQFTTPKIEHPRYHQHFKGFEPGCSILDVLFQFGPECFRILDKLALFRQTGDS